MTEYIEYWGAMIRCALRGSRRYWAWVTLLFVLVAIGLVAYSIQWNRGFIVTNMTDQVSWGAYIANFTFLVGVAAAAVLLVVPTYWFKQSDIKRVVLLGELMAFCAMVMCLLFVTVDIGRPDRILHMAPILGRLNFPRSILAWDIIVLSVYLLLNLHIPGYLLYQKYRARVPSGAYYLPFVFLAMGWAVSIHTVTAFLYSGLGSRPFWNTAVMAPRFLISAFASGPAILILVFHAVHRYGGFDVKDGVFSLLRRIIAVTLPINVFLFGCEIFKDFYTQSSHMASLEYLFFGLHGHAMLSPYIWLSLACTALALVIFLSPRFRENRALLLVGSSACVVGIWIEKGMGLIIPGFIPSPLGDLVEYTPSAIEFFVCLGIWALGALLFTVISKVAIAIETGVLRTSRAS